MEHGCNGEAVNLGSGVGVSVREAVELVLEVSGHAVRPVYDETKPTAIPYRRLSLSKYEALRGGAVRRTSLRDGIAKTIEWYRTIGSPAIAGPR